MSPVLFNAALEKMMRELEGEWARKRWGIKTIMQRRLLDLRFADDLLLVASSLHQAKGMLGDLMQKARQYGLQVHSGKTKLMWNGFGRSTSARHIEIDANKFEILVGAASTDYLGRLLNLDDVHQGRGAVLRILRHLGQPAERAAERSTLHQPPESGRGHSARDHDPLLQLRAG